MVIRFPPWTRCFCAFKFVHGGKRPSSACLLRLTEGRLQAQLEAHLPTRSTRSRAFLRPARGYCMKSARRTARRGGLATIVIFAVTA
jgi:hypothetical protein